jgi:hypothetical protein|uniref:glycerophosphoryl diester phosphodiesterase membrane domain-containing protein n=1 Tax=Altererythrobacter segetis TaxID=1104773 RepID=UPI0014083672|nr:glycerophosphoryl diester phosphodiesterase membrane domain-containing protein [Altererythrobacter segetis]
MKLEMNLAWSDAVRRIGGNRDVILVVAGVFFFLPYFAFMLISPDPLAGMSAAASNDAKAVMERLSAFYGQLWWVILIIIVVQAAGMLGLIALLSDRRRPTVAQALKLGARKVLSYITAYLVLGMALSFALMVVLLLAALTGATWLAGIVIFAGLVAWAVLFVRFSLVPPILIKENVGSPLKALARSWQLTHGNGGRLFAFFVLLFAAYIVVMLVVSMVLGLLFGLFGTEAAHFGEALVGSMLNAAWVTTFLAVLSAVHAQFAGPSPAALSETFE